MRQGRAYEFRQIVFFLIPAARRTHGISRKTILKLSDYVADFVARQGVKHVFLAPGEGGDAPERLVLSPRRDGVRFQSARAGERERPAHTVIQSSS
jgi:hypothetical protein